MHERQALSSTCLQRLEVYIVFLLAAEPFLVQGLDERALRFKRVLTDGGWALDRRLEW